MGVSINMSGHITSWSQLREELEFAQQLPDIYVFIQFLLTYQSSLWCCRPMHRLMRCPLCRPLVASHPLMLSSLLYCLRRRLMRRPLLSASTALVVCPAAS